ncbi:GntR family transcriptional regulator [Aeromicrobium sp. Root236]|uniref:GntR family transcriptional regulator n=1 Tax=Aeromicrobium sp. Root236 TaxID=1736498 RepID=UPI0009E8525E|nr:GntR family transcriptional regulator [Aeromicrobium sp. Root236]
MRTLQVDDEALGDKPDLSAMTDNGPSHARIASWLLGRIGSGKVRADDKLPPEEELAAGLGVSRMTLRQALGSLEARGYIERRRGRSGGNFVREPRIEVDLSGLPGFTELMRRANVRAGARIVRAGIVTASPEMATALELGRDRDVIEVVRVRSARRVPLALEETYLPAHLFPGFLDHGLTGSLYGLMRQHYDLAPHKAKEWLEPEISTPEHAGLLEVEPGSALMLVTRKASTVTGTPVEYAHDRYRPDRTRISLNTGIDPGSVPELNIEPV